MYKTITREECIEALRTEPLGCFGNFSEDNDDPSCRVCAVGAIFRKVLGAVNNMDFCSLGHVNVPQPMIVEIMSAQNYEHASYVAGLLIESGEAPLSVLSSLYEFNRFGYCWRQELAEAVEIVRERMIAFVTASFPTTVDVWVH